MGKLLNGLFWLIDLFNTESADPVLAAFKRSQRNVVVSSAGALIFLILALAFDPDSNASIQSQVQYAIASGFALLSAVFALCMAWSVWRCLHIYFKPDDYSH